MSNLKVNTINDASGGSAAVLYGVASPPNSMGFRNRIINGDMRIDQRNAGASVTPNGYTLDRWSCITQSGSGHAVQQVADAPTGFANSLRFTVGTGATPTSGQQSILWQPIEGFNVADFGLGAAGALTFTASFWVRASVTGTYGVWFQNTGSLRSFINQITINSANTWEYKTVTVAGDTSGTWLKNNGIGLMMGLSLGAGSTFQTAAGSWAAGDFKTSSSAVSIIATSGATFYITGVQLEAGTVATPFERRDYGRELMMCQRYYEKSFPQGTAPANGGSSTTLATADGSVSGMAQNRIGAGPTTQFKVPKRAIPTMTKYGNSSGDWIYALQNSNALVGNANSGLGRVSESAFTADQQIVDGTAIFVIGHWTASAEL